jgi:lysophospholipase L1-like esterase
VIESVAAARNVPLVTYQGERLDIVHPTREGYRTLAERLARTIDEHGYLE